MDSNNWREERRRRRDEWRMEREKFRQQIRERYHWRESKNGRVWMGLFLLLIGAAALIKLTLFPQVRWLYDWPMILIIIGLFIGVRHGFRGSSWFIMLLIGGIFLIRNNFPDLIEYQYVWPVALIVLGLFFIMRPRRSRWHWREWDETGEEKKTDSTNAGDHTTTFNEDEELIDSTSFFGGAKKKVLSKNFKGGDITNIFGGAEIDLSQADINGEARLDLTQIFGGTKIIIPANWKLIMKNAAILGGVEDKRPNQPYDPNKTLVLTGTSIFGGIEIRSY